MTVYTQSEDLVSDFISRGLVLLHPDTLKVDRRIHDRIYEKEKTLFRAKEYITAENLPEILEVLRANFVPNFKFFYDGLTLLRLRQ